MSGSVPLFYREGVPFCEAVLRSGAPGNKKHWPETAAPLRDFVAGFEAQDDIVPRGFLPPGRNPRRVPTRRWWDAVSVELVTLGWSRTMGGSGRESLI